MKNLFIVSCMAFRKKPDGSFQIRHTPCTAWADTLDEATAEAVERYKNLAPPEHGWLGHNAAAQPMQSGLMGIVEQLRAIQEADDEGWS